MIKASKRKQSVRMERSERRTQLLDTAEEILLEGGRDALSIQRLASDAGIARTVVYSHFADVSEIIREVLERQWRELSKTLPPPEEDESVEASLRRIAKYFLGSGARMRRLQQLLRATSTDPVAGPLARTRMGKRQSRWTRRLMISAGVDEANATILASIVMSSLGGLARFNFKTAAEREKTVEVYVQCMLGAIERVQSTQ